jgi:hypothetical protein
VTLEAEADPLIAKLEALAGAPASDSATSAERRARLESLWPSLRTHIDARVNGTPLVFELGDTTVDDTSQAAINLTTRTPAGPHLFTWRSTFVFGAHQVTIKSGRRADLVQWLQGRQTSDPIALEPWDAEAEASALRPFGSRLFNNRISPWPCDGARSFWSFSAAAGAVNGSPADSSAHV